jgi:hypothetical protein
MTGTRPSAPVGFEPVLPVADAILYEGYLLYPYRRSAAKNRVRWQFGMLLPRAWADAHGLTDTSVAGSAESWWQQTECLLRATGDTEVKLRVRFLQLQDKTVAERTSSAGFRPVGALDLGSRLELSFAEAGPREFDASLPIPALLGGERRLSFRMPGGEDTEPLADERGRLAGQVIRRRWPVTGSLTVDAVRAVADDPVRLRVRVENADCGTPMTAPRDEALRRSLIACHCLLAAERGSFISLLDPPRWAEAAARACRNVHTFPVLAGDPGSRDLVLSSPILLYDHPRIAPESPGDLHDATEIDEILSLRTLTLSDAEKREARGTDARAAAILDRADGMPEETLARLHGAMRPGSGSVTIAGELVSKGSRVRLRPRRHGTDPQDMFLDGRTAQVDAVLHDVDGSCHLAVTVEDDPGAELNRWYGRFRYFAPEEVEPLPGGEDPADREDPADGEDR